jgi:hypothetical protein
MESLMFVPPAFGYDYYFAILFRDCQDEKTIDRKKTDLEKYPDLFVEG